MDKDSLGKIYYFPQNKKKMILEVEEETKLLPGIDFEIALEITSQNMKSASYFSGLKGSCPRN